MNKHLLATAVILIIFFSSTAFYPWQASLPQRAHLQDTTAYPIETEQPYGGPDQPTETAYPAVPDATESATLSPSPGTTLTPNLEDTLSPSQPALPSPTVGPSPTTVRDLFSTEDAEIRNSRVTLRASETVPPSRTPQHSATPLPSPSATPSPPFVFDRSWFLAGLIIPAGLLFVGWLIFRMKNSGEFKT